MVPCPRLRVVARAWQKRRAVMTEGEIQRARDRECVRAREGVHGCARASACLEAEMTVFSRLPLPYDPVLTDFDVLVLDGLVLRRKRHGDLPQRPLREPEKCSDASACIS